MTNDTMLGGLYIVIALTLVIGALISRREPIAKLLVIAFAWLAIFGAGFVLFTFRDDLSYLGQRLQAEATGEPVEVGRTLRIPMAIDGHFWVEAAVNGQPVRFLVDSGATMTTIDRDTARRAGIDVDPMRSDVVRTGNGLIRVAAGRANSVKIGDIERERVGMHITEQAEINVLGMNFLSSLDRWGVEGRWLVLES
ncbi:TIGR02281 family clan AA aspartic protease [Sphingomonas sp. HDW15A]|uniref:retropepsin-like aspartic protease family protein n=1 Tax=Sphingomonas sp. HDW15A TaxID=2714942 RepID=UPI001407C952|nr:TIGR02281 family clan AA aspartic protease [Sphingomonas sp. HDW15A]QIK96064.1 TIGR02281 family clan AA aspartic protease [Sphingomonas sp. HDW15A]